MPNRNISFGSWGETEAIQFLEGKGYQVIERNIRTPFGEIDIIAELGGKLFFTEVKTRSNLSFGNPEDSINPRKLEHMENSAQFFVQENEFQGTWQIDVISITKKGNEKSTIVHFENVIS